MTLNSLFLGTVTGPEMQAHDFLKVLAKVQVNVLCPFMLIFSPWAPLELCGWRVCRSIVKTGMDSTWGGKLQDASCNIF